MPSACQFGMKFIRLIQKNVFGNFFSNITGNFFKNPGCSSKNSFEDFLKKTASEILSKTWSSNLCRSSSKNFFIKYFANFFNSKLNIISSEVPSRIPSVNKFLKYFPKKYFQNFQRFSKRNRYTSEEISKVVSKKN